MDYESCTGTIVGCDYAGTVEAIGCGVRKTFNKGDRVAGFVHGCNVIHPNGGAFAEYVIAKADLQIRIPDSMSLEQAACLGVGMMTIGQNLYQSLQLPQPTSEGNTEDRKYAKDAGDTASILIYGGATATGSLAIQFAKFSGLKVITTCSETNRSFMYKLGADSVFDYHDAQVGKRIRESTDDDLELVFDTISTPASAGICAAAISSAGGCYNGLLSLKFPRDDVDTHISMAYDMIGESYRIGGQEVPGDSENFDFGCKWIPIVERLLEDQLLTPHPFQIKQGGLAGIPEGLQMLRKGIVRACKLVYRVQEID